MVMMVKHDDGWKNQFIWQITVFIQEAVVTGCSEQIAANVLSIVLATVLVE